MSYAPSEPLWNKQFKSENLREDIDDLQTTVSQLQTTVSQLKTQVNELLDFMKALFYHPDMHFAKELAKKYPNLSRGPNATLHVVPLDPST